MWSIVNLGRNGDVCDEVREKLVDICCLKVVEWRGHGSRIMGVYGRRCCLWWYTNEVFDCLFSLI